MCVSVDEYTEDDNFHYKHQPEEPARSDIDIIFFLFLAFFLPSPQREFLSSNFRRFPVKILKELAQRMVLVPKDGDVVQGA